MARQSKKQREVPQSGKQHAVPHILERFKGQNVMEMLRKAGTHFDIGKKKSTIAELIALDGLFSLKDVQDRLPIPDRRLQSLIRDKGHFGSCFVALYKTAAANSGTIHVDLKRLCHLLHEQLLKMEQKIERQIEQQIEPLEPDILEDA